jgi:hypothetical protein
MRQQKTSDALCRQASKSEILYKSNGGLLGADSALMSVALLQTPVYAQCSLHIFVCVPRSSRIDPTIDKRLLQYL